MLRLFVPPSNLRCNRQSLLTYSKCQKLNISSFVCILNTKCHPSKMYEERQSKERERERERKIEKERRKKNPYCFITVYNEIIFAHFVNLN